MRSPDDARRDPRPGDLTVKKADPRFKRVFDRTIVYEVGSESENVGLAVVPGNYRAALLFAAAPDLYAVAKEMQEAWAYFSEYDVPINLKAKLDAAIAKAEGGEG